MNWHNNLLLLGRLHPLLVHLPIGGLVLALCLELLARFARFRDAAQQNRLILALSAAAAIAAAACGWVLSTSGGYDPDLLRWHRWSGIALAAACLGTVAASLSGKLLVYRFSLAAAMALLITAGHLGASLTHGKDFLTEYAPPTVRRWLGQPLRANAQATRSLQKVEAPVYASAVAPLLLRNCASCHGADKHKGDLRVDNYVLLLKGGKNGAVVVPGDAQASELIRRMQLPGDNEDHMPPSGRPQPTSAEIRLLLWWINTGAQTNRTAAELTAGPDIQRLLRGSADW